MDRSAHRTAARPPAAVRRSFLLWLVAVGAGVVETAIVIAVSDPSPALLVGVLLRTAVFAGVVLLSVQLLHGRRWARTTLALVPGLLGTLSLVGAPLWELLQGTPPSLPTTGTDALFAAVRTVHVGCVWAATALMFTAQAAWYLRGGLPRISAGPSGWRRRAG